MKIRYLESGGLAGVLRGCNIDSADLPLDLRKILENLIKAPPPPPSTKGRDTITYVLHIETPQAPLKITLDDLALTEDLYPLLEALGDIAQPLDIKD